MSEEPVTLREYLESLIRSLREHTDQLSTAHTQSHADALRSGLMFWENHRREHDAEHLVVEKANEGMSVRLAGMNEFRAQLREQQATFITREGHEAQMKALADRLAAMERDRAGDEGARLRGERATRTWIGVLGVVVAAVVIVVNIAIKIL